MKLSDLNINAKGKVKQILEDVFSNQLFESGILPGVEFTIISKAPFKGPIYIKVEDNLIALRAAHAESIIVQ
ncbi:MAG: FeoA family protein [Crocinitomicaceae bacterium]